jgi:hypothetical protein
MLVVATNARLEGNSAKEWFGFDDILAWCNCVFKFKFKYTQWRQTHRDFPPAMMILGGRRAKAHVALAMSLSVAKRRQ